MPQDFWVGFGAGIVTCAIVLAVIVPDPWSRWFVSIRNVPTWMLPFGIVLLVVALGNLLIAGGWAFLQALGLVSIAPWVWIALAVGVVVVAIFTIVRRLRQQPVQPAQPPANP